ncbi:MAG: UDP-glucose 4-epimerase GalE [Deltaproteobacteria bacterium]|nr:UDP-glucose 4-epimerase GalE [Deltaproteobacteria bacterium]
MHVLVTGGAGYIGSHVAYALVDAGHEVIVLDALTTGARQNVPPSAELVVGRVGDASLVRKVLRDGSIDSVIHLAGSIVVPESVEHPLEYYDNNVVESRALLEVCVEERVSRFVFSSSAAVYGAAERVPVDESAPTNPITPYGRTKLIMEWMLEDVARASSLRYVALRYFNVAGADPGGRTGQSGPNCTHLIKVAVQAACGLRAGMQLFGTDYATPDGTCIRDYVHVSDLAEAHKIALRGLVDGTVSGPMNCGYGRGFSTREVIEAVKRVSGASFSVEEAPRRAGDPPKLVSNPARLMALGFEPRFASLDGIVRSALEWEKRLSERQGR